MRACVQVRGLSCQDVGFDLDTQLQKYLVSLDKRSRRCSVINLAHLEIFLTLITKIHRFNLRLFKTNVKDIEFGYEFVFLHCQ